MTHGHGGLLDDRPVVEVLGHIVSGGTNQLDPPLPGPVIGLRALESRQKGVMDVDHIRETLQKITTEHLHVLGEHREFDPVLRQQLQHLLLSLRFSRLGDWNADKTNPEPSTKGFEIRVVGDDQRHLHRQFTALHPPQQILKAVGLLAGEDRHPRHCIGKVQLSLTVQTLLQCCSCLGQGSPRQTEAIEIPLDPTEKQPCPRIGVVVGVADVAAVGGHPTCQLTDQPRTIRADHLQDHRDVTHDEGLKNKFSRAEQAG